MKKNTPIPIIYLIIILIFLLALASLRLVFDLDLRGEDWYSLWIAIQPELKDSIFKTVLFRDHPISTYQEVVFGRFFGFNVLYWHIFGYLLKVINAFAVGLLMFGLTNSKKASIYSSLIFAASAIGLESYTALYAQAPALIILPMCLGLYFWVTSERENSKKKYLISIVFCLASFLADPGRGVSILILCLVWDFLCLLQSIHIKNLVKLIARNSLLLLLAVLPYLLSGLGAEQFTTGHPSNLFKGINYIMNHQWSVLDNLAYSLGNLVIGWVITLYEPGHMSQADTRSLIGGYLFLSCSNST